MPSGCTSDGGEEGLEFDGLLSCWGVLMEGWGFVSCWGVLMEVFMGS